MGGVDIIPSLVFSTEEEMPKKGKNSVAIEKHADIVEYLKSLPPGMKVKTIL